MSSEIAIVVAAFDRPWALHRLLESLRAADLPSSVCLVISIDGGGGARVREIATKFRDSRLRVRVRCFDENIGLRAHILACGDLVTEYENIILLEDDLIVDKHFYTYCEEAERFYRDEADVAGVALYSPRHNELANLPFEALQNGYDTYFMRVPCSWGQMWTKSQWSGFREWYSTLDGNFTLPSYALPPQVARWPASSWKKYFYAYLALEGMHFVYPYSSYTTNCADSGGTHMRSGTDRFQVPMPFGRERPRALDACPSEAREIFYDEYMEQQGRFLADALGVSQGDLQCDLYGTKPASVLSDSKYVITTRRVANPVSAFPMTFRPIERNLLFSSDMKSAGIYLVEYEASFTKSGSGTHSSLIKYFLRVPLAKLYGSTYSFRLMMGYVKMKLLSLFTKKN